MSDKRESNMTIWVVWYNNFDGEDEFIGAFSSEANARARIDKYGKFDQRSFRIEEDTLDDY